mmetsp:Transcript_75223/g.213935  ORF Transcript_75223/g.213935 Transcript_75223/m.213935 type:complete len:203 (-) Transcript_75223:386-994(-)
MALCAASKIGRHGTPCDIFTRRAPPLAAELASRSRCRPAVSRAIFLMSKSFALPTCATTLGAPTAMGGRGEANEADEEGARTLCERTPMCAPIVKALSETMVIAPATSALRRWAERCCTKARPPMMARAAATLAQPKEALAFVWRGVVCCGGAASVLSIYGSACLLAGFIACSATSFTISTFAELISSFSSSAGGAADVPVC